MHPGDLIVVGARPGVGKTSFGLSVMKNTILSNNRVGFISTEMSATQLGFRLYSQLTGIAGNKFRSANLHDNEWQTIASVSCDLERIGDLGRICDATVMKASDIAMQARAWALDGGLDFLIIDYLTRLKPDTIANNQNLIIGDIVTQIKSLARDLDIPIMLLAQLNRNPANRADTTPKMSDLRDSGIIEQEADSVLLLHREELSEYVKKNSIIIDKNRHGISSIAAIVDFDESTMQWR
jgi:replicative DNA helicase